MDLYYELFLLTHLYNVAVAVHHKTIAHKVWIRFNIDWKTPSEAALCTGELKKKWVSRRENFIKAEVA